MRYLTVTSLVEAWNITVHRITRDGSYFTNKLLYSRTRKKRHLVLLWEKSHIYWDSCLHLLYVWLLWQTNFIFTDRTWLNINVQLKWGWIYIYGHSSYNHMEVCSLTKNIKTWDKQTKACKTFLNNQIYSKQLWLLGYWGKKQGCGKHSNVVSV